MENEARAIGFHPKLIRWLGKMKFGCLFFNSLCLVAAFGPVIGGAEGFDHFRPDFHISEGRKFLTTL